MATRIRQDLSAAAGVVNWARAASVDSKAQPLLFVIRGASMRSQGRSLRAMHNCRSSVHCEITIENRNRETTCGEGEKFARIGEAHTEWWEKDIAGTFRGWVPSGSTSRDTALFVFAAFAFVGFALPAMMRSMRSLQMNPFAQGKERWTNQMVCKREINADCSNSTIPSSPSFASRAV